MAYVVDLDDEFTDTDIPTTLIRSKADCPSMEVQRTGSGPGLVYSSPPKRDAISCLNVSGSDDFDHQRHCDLQTDPDPVLPQAGNPAQEDEEEGQR